MLRGKGQAVNESASLPSRSFWDDFSPGGSDYSTKCTDTWEVLVNSGNPSGPEVWKLPVSWHQGRKLASTR